MKNSPIEAADVTRYKLNHSSYSQLQRDYIRFKQEYTEKFPYNYINRILHNYLCYRGEKDSSKFIEEIEELLKSKIKSKSYHDDKISFNKEVAEKFNVFPFVTNSKFNKNTVVSYILQNYTELKLSEREKIYFYKQYKSIINAIDNKEIITINMNDNNSYDVKPYRLEVDDNSLSYYLVGYSKRNQIDEEYLCYSFKLSRIISCIETYTSFSITPMEKAQANTMIEKYGTSYIYQNPTDKSQDRIQVHLTERGYKQLYLRIISHQRPLPINEPKPIIKNDTTYYELEFDCSQYQIMYYFFSFGSEAEIISPDSLRQQFIQKYKSALNFYQKRYMT